MLWLPFPAVRQPFSITIMKCRPLMQCSIIWLDSKALITRGLMPPLLLTWRASGRTTSPPSPQPFTVSSQRSVAPVMDYGTRLIQDRGVPFRSHSLTIYRSLTIGETKKDESGSTTANRRAFNFVSGAVSYWSYVVWPSDQIRSHAPTHLTPKEAVQTLNGHFASICKQLPPSPRISPPSRLPVSRQHSPSFSVL